MLAFRFCVVVSAGAIAILGYGANASAGEMPPESELQSVREFATDPATAREPAAEQIETKLAPSSGLEDLSPSPEASGQNASLADDEPTISQTPTVSDSPPTEPVSGGATDSPSDDDSVPIPPSSHPRREKPIAIEPETPVEPASIAEVPAPDTRANLPDAPAPDVATSDEQRAASPSAAPAASVNTQSILEAFKTAIVEAAPAATADIAGITPAAMPPEPALQRAEMPSTPAPSNVPTEAVLIVESDPSEAPRLLEIFKEAIARFEGVEYAIVTENPTEPDKPVSTSTSASFSASNFVPFERILNRFRAVANAGERTSVLPSDRAIPVPNHLLNPGGLLRDFKGLTAQAESAAAPPASSRNAADETQPSSRLPEGAIAPQTVIDAFAAIMQDAVRAEAPARAENLPEPVAPTLEAQNFTPFERILDRFNRVTLELPETNASPAPSSPAPATAEAAEEPTRVPEVTSSAAPSIPAPTTAEAAANPTTSQLEATPSAVATEVVSQPASPSLPSAESILAAFGNAIGVEEIATSGLGESAEAMPVRPTTESAIAQSPTPNATAADAPTPGESAEAMPVRPTTESAIAQSPTPNAVAAESPTNRSGKETTFDRLFEGFQQAAEARVQTESAAVSEPASSSLPNPASVLEAFANAIATEPAKPPTQSPAPALTPTSDATTQSLRPPVSPSARQSSVANVPENGITPPALAQPPILSQTSFAPFERILERFKTYNPPQSAIEEEVPTVEATPTSTIEADIAQTAPLPSSAIDFTFPSPRSVLDAFQQVIVNPPASAAEVVIEPTPLPLPEPEIVPDSASPPETPTAPPSPPEAQEPARRELIDPQPAAALEGVDPPEYLDSSTNPLVFPTQAEEVEIDISQPITLQQAIELARRNNPTLQGSRIQLDIAREQLREALAAEYPTLSTQFNFTRTDSAQQQLNNFNQNNSLSNLLGRSVDNNNITTSADAQLDLNYDLFTGGRRTAQIRAAEEQVRFNQLNVETLAEQTRFEVAQAYYNLQEADAQVDIEQAAVADATRTLRDAELLEQAGLGTRFDVLRAQVDLANSQQNLATAQSRQLTSRRELATNLGLGQQVIVTAADPIERAGSWDLPLAETIVLAFKNRAELEQQLVQRNISEQQREIALSALRPQVSLFANYNILGIVNDNQGLGDGYSVGARLQWTLFEGGAARARAAQQERNIELAESRFDEQRNQVRLEVEQAYNNLQASEDNIQTANIALQLAQESLRLARLRFSAGVGTQTDVINAQTELTRARGNLLSAIISYNQSLAALQRAVSNLPDNRLFDLP